MPSETMTSAKSSCSVCHEALEAHTETYCNVCGLPFHLNQRSDIPGKDCGEVSISDEHLGLEFFCRNCIEMEPADSGALGDIMDAGEAALAAGLTEEQLVAAAEEGKIAHRRTKGGTYLFERRAVLLFVRERASL
jgi:hypothetical protein